MAVMTQTLYGSPTAVGAAGPFTLVVDRPAVDGGQGLGFNGGELLHLAVAACISNDLFREADKRGIRLGTVRVRVDGGFGGVPVVARPITVDIELDGDEPRRLRELVDDVMDIAEIPNTLRHTTEVRLGDVRIH